MPIANLKVCQPGFSGTKVKNWLKENFRTSSSQHATTQAALFAAPRFRNLEPRELVSIAWTTETIHWKFIMNQFYPYCMEIQYFIRLQRPRSLRDPFIHTFCSAGCPHDASCPTGYPLYEAILRVYAVIFNTCSFWLKTTLHAEPERVATALG